MILRMSTSFLRTLRDDPADAEVPSHKLLVRAGYIRRAAPGVYTWLPLGLRVLRKIEDVVRAEMDGIGAQELQFPALLPREPYEETGRWAEYGDGVFRVKDRKGADYLLGPTHEEMFTLAVKDLYSSYKDLPVTLYQIQTKYRDEARPRAGLLRGREFVMKDSYSFAVDQAGLDQAYQEHRAAYVKIFDALGLDYVIVQATAGAMGGSKSEEFLAVAANGEDTFVRCDTCDYAANVEAVRVRPGQAQDFSDLPTATRISTPGATTIQSLVTCLNQDFGQAEPWTAAQTLKHVLFMLTHPDGRKEPLAVGLPGDRELDPKRLEAQFEPITVEPMSDADFARYPLLIKGYIGPSLLGAESEYEIRYLVDPRVAEGTAWVTGADEADTHQRDVVSGRDFNPDGLIEAAEIRDGDDCPVCAGHLATARGVEMGHIFQLGQKYAQALDLKVLDENGKLVTVTMGSYGVGVSRAVAMVAENTHDEAGLNWPLRLAPAQVHLVATGKDPQVFAAAEELAQDLHARGVEVIYDDRVKVSPGVKFKDAELIGVPLIVVVGKGLEQGTVELKERSTGERVEIAVQEAAEVIAQRARPTAN